MGKDYGDENNLCSMCGYRRDGACLDYWVTLRSEPVVVAAYMEDENYEQRWLSGVGDVGLDVQKRRKELREILKERWKMMGMPEEWC